MRDLERSSCRWKHKRSTCCGIFICLELLWVFHLRNTGSWAIFLQYIAQAIAWLWNIYLPLIHLILSALEFFWVFHLRNAGSWAIFLPFKIKAITRLWNIYLILNSSDLICPWIPRVFHLHNTGSCAHLPAIENTSDRLAMEYIYLPSNSSHRRK